MSKGILLLLFIASSIHAQVEISIDKFNSASSFYTAFNNGSGTVNTSNNFSDFVSGNASLQIDYSFNSGTNYFFSVFKNYSTATKDWSFNSTKFILRHKNGSNKTVLKLRLWEDINRNGSSDNEDEVFVCSTNITAGQTTWTLSEFLIADFIKLSGNGNGNLDLNRIRGWDIAIENTSALSHSSQILFDELLLQSSYTPPTNSTAKLSGSFVQLWNSNGCSCGQWSLQQWKYEFEKMKDACMSTFVIQYGVYNDLSWYSPSNLSFVNYKENTLNKIFEAAEEKGIHVYVGLYFDENWNSADKSSSATYSNLLTKHQKTIDEIYSLFGNSSAFKGWYIPQEINDLEWQNNPAKDLLFNWVQNVASYAHSKSTNKKVMIAPFFNLWMPADVLKNWYDEFLSIATDIDQVFPQDGVGITLKNVNYDVPLFYSKIKEACDAHSVEFGATVESFQQLTGWPIDNGNFSAQSADVNRLKTQIWEAQTHNPVEIIQFEWAYMQGDLYSDYLNYSSCNTTSVIEKQNNEFIIYPNPADHILHFSSNLEKVKIYNSLGSTLSTYTNCDEISLNNFDSGIYFIEAEAANKVCKGTFVKQ